MNTATPVFDLVGSKIFKYLYSEDILNCRKINKQCKIIIDDPHFLLKLLKSVGQPEECHKKWIALIQKCHEVGIPKDTFALILLHKYRNLLMRPTQTQNICQNWQLAMPPIYNAVKTGHLEAVKAIVQVDEDFYKPLPHYEKGVKWRPFIQAALYGHFEIAEFLDSKIENQMISERTKWLVRTEMIAEAMYWKEDKTDLIKFLLMHIENPFACMKGGSTLLHLAAKRKKYKLLEFFADFTNDIHKIINRQGLTVIEEALEHLEARP